jgi:tRNA(fMet)-specific endonuclease VapC
VLILDTDHFSALTRGTAEGKRLRHRLDGAEILFATTIVLIEEGFRGWTAEAARAKSGAARLRAYGSFSAFVRVVSIWHVLDWTVDAEACFTDLLLLKLGIGNMDLRIAAIALAGHATLLSRNLRDFEQIPGLMVENWLD